ncbi:MAG: class I SAM-dependent methyltransferase [Clostridia bacterium]|nr:class I SAM-dependent methyltransferase [Clostridia bacterium]
MIKSSLALSEYEVFSDFAGNFNLSGKAVLEIGGCLPYEYIKGCNPKVWVAVDPRNEDKTLNEQYKSVKGFAQLIPAPNNTYDYIFSCNAFHHISQFEQAVKEFFRVLKPNGVVYSNFGPIWSAPDGSHLENVNYNGKVYNFWENRIVPDWYHLIYNCREIFDILSSRLEYGLAKTIAEYIYLSSWLNRMEYEDYSRILKKSPFKIEFFEGTTELGYEVTLPDYDNPYEWKVKEWKERVGDRLNDYRLRDLKICLRKV